MTVNWPMKSAPNLSLCSMDTESAARMFSWKFKFFLEILMALMAMVFFHYCSMHMDEFGTSD